MYAVTYETEDMGCVVNRKEQPMLNTDYAASITFYRIETGEQFTVDCNDLIDCSTRDDLISFFERESNCDLSLLLARAVISLHNSINYSRAVTPFTDENKRLHDLRTTLVASGYNFFIRDIYYE